MRLIDDFSAFIFDLDGTIYLGDKLIKGASQVIREIKEQNKPFVFLTNKPLASREDYARKLSELGIPASAGNIITSSFVTARYLKKNSPGASCYVVGERALKEELTRAGLQVKEQTDSIDYLIASFDRDFHYDKLNDALQILKKGARFIATNPDRTCPVENGEIPDAAGMIGAIEGVTGKKVEKILGKPSREIVETALKQMGSPDPQKSLMIGDRLETDIIMGKENNLRTALVLSGVTDRKALHNSEIKPDIVLETILGLIDAAYVV